MVRLSGCEPQSCECQTTHNPNSLAFKALFPRVVCRRTPTASALAPRSLDLPNLWVLQYPQISWSPNSQTCGCFFTHSFGFSASVASISQTCGCLTTHNSEAEGSLRPAPLTSTAPRQFLPNQSTAALFAAKTFQEELPGRLTGSLAPATYWRSLRSTNTLA